MSVSWKMARAPSMHGMSNRLLAYCSSSWIITHSRQDMCPQLAHKNDLGRGIWHANVGASKVVDVARQVLQLGSKGEAKESP